MTTSQKWDVIVVGGGLAGLTAGAYLTAAGKRTLVLEYGDVVGGSTHVFRRRNRWEFDVGVHHLGNLGPDGHLPTILRGLGLDDRIEFLPMDPDGFEIYHMPDFEFSAPRGLDNYTDRLIAAFPADERGLRKFMRVMRGIGGPIDRGRTPASSRGLIDYALGARQHARWTLLPLQKLFDACGLSRRAQLVLCMPNLSYETPPSRAPIAMHAAFLWDFYELGAGYPRGGGQVFAAHLTDVVRTHGGGVRTGARVERILLEGGRVTGVALVGGERLSAPVVVSSADLKRTMLDMVGREHLKTRTVKKVRGGRTALPWFNAYLGLDVDLRDQVPNADHHSFPTWDSFEDLFKLMEGPADRDDAWLADLGRRLPAYIHSSTVKDPDNPHYAPPGHSSLEVMVPISPNLKRWGLDSGPFDGADYRKNPAYLELKEHLTDVMVARAEEALPGLVKDHVLWREAGTPVTQERYTLPTAGSAYGLEIAVGQFAQFGRHGVRTEIPGLFLAGSSCAWGPGVEGVMHSGIYAASAVLGRDLPAEIRAGAVLGDRSKLTPMGADWDPLEVSRRLDRQPLTAATAGDAS
ncbi:MAG: phytoene desaturase family protein [Sporichthyaceae bacterium]